MKQERHPRDLTEDGALALLWRSVQNSCYRPSHRRERHTWEIIRAPVGKADTGDYFAVFAPLSLQFLERLER